MVSNLYPPHYKGGYEVRCQQMASALSGARHEVQVVTSVYGLSRHGRRRPQVEKPEGAVLVHRCLSQSAFPPVPRLRPWTYFQARAELRDLRRFQRIVEGFRPDAVVWWNLNGLSKLLLAVPRRRNIPDLYWVEGEWMIEELGPKGEIALRFWNTVWQGEWGPRPLGPLIRASGHLWEAWTGREGVSARSFDPSSSHACFVSAFMAEQHRRAGIEFSSSEVIWGGVPVEQFLQTARHDTGNGPLRLLYAGQLSPDRGLHTIVEALGQMPPPIRAGIRLGIAGSGQDTYVAQVRAEVERLGLSDCIGFLGKVPHERMPDLFREHHVLIFPSSRPEGLPLTVVEAMLSGCAVVTTEAGGAREIAALADLPTFKADDPTGLRQHIVALAADRGLVQEIAERGQQRALERLGLDDTVRRFIQTLERLKAREVAAH